MKANVKANVKLQVTLQVKATPALVKLGLRAALIDVVCDALTNAGIVGHKGDGFRIQSAVVGLVSPSLPK